METSVISGLETRSGNFFIEFFSKKFNKSLYFFANLAGDSLLRMSEDTEWENALTKWGKKPHEVEVSGEVLARAERLESISQVCGFSIRRLFPLSWDDLGQEFRWEGLAIVGTLKKGIYSPLDERVEGGRGIIAFIKANSSQEHIVVRDLEDDEYSIRQLDERLVSNILRNEEKIKNTLSKFTNEIVKIFKDEIGNYFVKLNEGYLYCSSCRVLRSIEDFSEARSYFEVSDEEKAKISDMILCSSLSLKLGMNIVQVKVLNTCEALDELHNNKDQEDTYLSGFYKNQQFFPEENSWWEEWDGPSYSHGGDSYMSSLNDFINKSGILPEMFIESSGFAYILCGEVLDQYLKGSEKAKKILKNMTLIIK